MAAFSDDIRARVDALSSDRVVSADPVFRGYSPAGRWRLRLQSGRSAFAKIGATAGTAEALRRERHIYGELHAPFMPELLGWEDHALQPIMILEDLGAAHWPPPWDATTIDEVRTTLNALHAMTVRLQSTIDLHGSTKDGWQNVAEDTEPFLQLGLATPAWLDRALPPLIQASSEVQEEGSDVVHLDVRSDNLCRAARGIVLVDWNWACLGNGALDTGFWLPSLQAEGGPEPEAILPGRPDIAACVSGFFAARAGLPPIPDAPHVRAVQLQQLRPALLWAARELGLPAPFVGELSGRAI
ncbi:MAG: aminoglycoside phosphotransferase family protein [Polyangiaceae bacterium]|nr:aminoglycoside phosphotransferase family protein [Polyangiaceae bacterium]